MHLHKASGLSIQGSTSQNAINNILMEHVVGARSGVEYFDLQGSQPTTLQGVTLFNSDTRNGVGIDVKGFDSLSWWELEAYAGSQLVSLRKMCSLTTDLLLSEGPSRWIINGIRKNARLRCHKTVRAPEGYLVRLVVTKSSFSQPSSRNFLGIYDSHQQDENFKVGSVDFSYQVSSSGTPLVFTSTTPVMTLSLIASTSQNALFVARLDVMRPGSNTTDFGNTKTLPMSDCIVENFDKGLSLSNVVGSELTVDSTVFKNNDFSVTITSSSGDFKMHNISVVDNNYGIRALSIVGTISLNNSLIQSNYVHGLFLYNIQGKVSITDVAVIENGRSVYSSIINDYGVRIQHTISQHGSYYLSNITCRDNPWYGIDLDLSSDTEVEIYDSYIKENGRGGIRMYSREVQSDQHSIVSIQNSTITRNGRFALQVTGRLRTLNFVGNTISANRCPYQPAMTIEGQAQNLSFTSNTVINNNAREALSLAMTGFLQYGIPSEIKIERNRFEANFFDPSMSDENQYEQHPDNTSCTIEIGGYKQSIQMHSNILDDQDMDYTVCSRVYSGTSDWTIRASYNWWGTAVETEIQGKIHDFDDWNDRAAVDYFPYLTGPDLSSPPADPSNRDVTMATDNIGGRLYNLLHLQKDGGPYTIKADLTVLKNASLTIDPGTTIKVHPCVGLLNLGSLVAQGTRSEPIIFELADVPVHQPQVRLVGGRYPWEGRVEVFYNGEWGSVCGRHYWDSQDANVVCRELGYGSSTVYSTYSFGQGSGPIWIGYYTSRPDCTGNEMSVFNCLRGPPGNVDSRCTHSYDVGIRCNMDTWVSPRPTCIMKKWGGITSKSATTEVLTNLKFSNTGNLHRRSHAAILIQKVHGTTDISSIEISECVGTGIQLLGMNTTQSVTNVNISGCDGYAGVSITGRKSSVMSSTKVRITDSVFTAGSFELTPHSITNCLANPGSIIRLCGGDSDLHLKNDMCFVHVETERTSSTCYKHLYAGVGFTVELTVSFVQFQSYSSRLRVFADGSHTQQIGHVTRSDNGKTYIRFVSQTMMSLQYISYYWDSNEIFGEVSFYNVRDVADPTKYIIETSTVDSTRGTVINVTTANGEIYDIQRNMFMHNQPRNNDNKQAVISCCPMDSYIGLRNNYIANNLMTSLSLDLTNQKGGNITVLGNRFFRNSGKSTIIVTGDSFSTTQQPILIDRNVFYSNDVGSNGNVVKFENVDGQLSNNVFFNNSGKHVVTWEGRSRTNSLQRCENNLFYDNIGLTPGEKHTLIVSGRDVQLHDNVLTNPANDAELATPNITGYDSVNATLNWWGFNSTSDISSRIRDKNDRGDWAEVHFQPWIQEEPTDGPCGLGWTYSQTFSACYRYMGGALSWGGAVQSCKAQYSVLSKRFDGPERDFIDSSLIARKVDFVPDVPVWMDNEMQGQENATVNCKVYLRDSQEAVQGVSCNSFFPYICKRPVVDDCPNYCSHHGRCEGETCICGRGWEGEDCSKFTCKDRNFCGEFGTCVGPNICRCRNGWQGRACTVSYCNRFTNCRTCTREVGCGWCEERQSCDSGLYRGPDVSPCMTSWFYNSCFTVGKRDKCSSQIEVLDCEQWQCNPSLPTTTVESCLRCQDVENCFKELDMLDYSDFSQEVQLEMAVDMKRNEGAPELSEVERVLSGNGTLDGNTVRVITEDAPVYKCIGSRAMNKGEGSYHLLMRDIPDNLSVGDVIVSNHSNGILEQVIQQTSTPLGVFIQTQLQDCFTTFNFRKELMTTDGVTLPASLPCSGGPEGAHGLLIVDSAGREVDLETGDVVVGRRSGRLLAKFP
ncbi:PREDICTED: protein bark beetle-like [Branchiostoma belcheri]|uniref:Protein bark beetle-like n=1 Tax=Branchiostoma belcheri TaxID=7741 RepID=A0A6P4YCK3_BRABE|nr:PREDICTED: protein bark beetle-like [Branchiostoma belcheri]